MRKENKKRGKRKKKRKKGGKRKKKRASKRKKRKGEEGFEEEEEKRGLRRRGRRGRREKRSELEGRGGNISLVVGGFLNLSDLFFGKPPPFCLCFCLFVSMGEKRRGRKPNNKQIIIKTKNKTKKKNKKQKTKNKKQNKKKKKKKTTWNNNRFSFTIKNKKRIIRNRSHPLLLSVCLIRFNHIRNINLPLIPLPRGLSTPLSSSPPHFVFFSW